MQRLHIRPVTGSAPMPPTWCSRGPTTNARVPVYSCIKRHCDTKFRNVVERELRRDARQQVGGESWLARPDSPVAARMRAHGFQASDTGLIYLYTAVCMVSFAHKWNYMQVRD